MGRQIIAIDIDDVLFPFVAELASLHNSIKGTKLAAKDFHCYHFVEVWGGTEDETTRLVSEVLGRDSRHVLPLFGARAALDRLVHRYDLHVVTSRPKAYEATTKEWLDHHFPKLFVGLDMVGNQYAGGSTHTKAEVCRRLGVRYVVDDQPKYVKECAEAGMDCVLFGDYGWNSDFELDERAIRCRSWAKTLEYFDGIG